MADEILTRDVNRRTVIAGVTDDSAKDIVQVRVDPSTSRLKTISTTTLSNVEYAEDSAHTTGDKGILVLAVRNDGGSVLAGTDLDYLPFTTDSTGAIRVTGGGGGIQYTEGDTDTTITGTAMLAESASDTLNVLQLDANKYLKVAQQGNITLGAGSNAIGKLAANSGVDIGDVDVTSVPAPLNVVGGGVEASALRVTIASDSTGVLSIDDGGGSITVDGTFWQATQPVSNAGTFATQATLQAGTASIGKLGANSGVDIGDVDVTSVVPGTGATNLGKAIDSAAGATDTGVAPLAVRDDALSALTPIEGDYTPIRVDANGALWVIPSGTVTVDGSGVTQPVSGTFWQATQPVSLASVPSHNVTNAGTFAVQSTLQTGSNAIGKLAANSGVDIGDTTLNNIWQSNTASDWKSADINDAVSGDNTIIAAVAGKQIAVWAILIVSDGTTDVRWEDGAAGTAFTGQIPLQAREGYAISGGGATPLFLGTANTLLNLELTAAINVHGFVSYTLV